MGRPIAEIAAEIRVKGYPLAACVTQARADGSRATVWGDSLTPADFAELRRLLDAPQPTPAGDPAQHARWRAYRAAALHDNE